MDYKKIKLLSYTDLKCIAQEMEIPIRRSKEALLVDVIAGLKEYEKYKRTKVDKYTRHSQLGNPGKEGTTYVVSDKHGNEYAMKTFRRQKSSDTLRNQAELQKLAAESDAAPNVIDIDTVHKCIVMERMDRHLLDVMKKQKGVLTITQQRQIIGLYRKLDNSGVFHGDANPMNYMYRGRKLYMIDFGMAKPITSSLVKKLGTDTPNVHIMSLGMVLKLKEMGCPQESYDYISKHATLTPGLL
jgi:tRNA A-37 threonylcarbamoyl transferase component Bud32